MNNPKLKLTTRIVLIGIITITVIIITSAIVSAQPPGMPGAPDQAPIDGGLGVLAAISAAYGIKKLKKQSK